MHVRARTVCLLVVAWLRAADARPGPSPPRHGRFGRASASGSHRAARFDRSRHLPRRARHRDARPERRAPHRQSGRHPGVAHPAAGNACAPRVARPHPPARHRPRPLQVSPTARTTCASIRAAAAAAAGGPPQRRRPSRSGRFRGAPPPRTEFVGKQRNASALNPEISATGDIRLVARERPAGDNGVAREFEVALQSALDPYSSTKIFLTFENEEVGVEEGYIYWTGLPGRLRLDVGKFRQQIGDLNRWHLHALPETEYPLVYQRFLSPEGLTGIGLSLYTALPVSLAGGTHEVWLQATTAESDAALRRRPATHRSSSGCRTSGSSAGRPTPSSAPRPPGGNNDDADLRSRLAGSRLPADLPPARGRHPPRDHAAGPRATGSTPPSWAPPPTDTAASWTSTPS